MATLFTHALVAASLGQAGKPGWRQDWRFWYVAVLCSILPDADVLGFRVGIHYGDLWGHRGMTHSLLFAAIIAVCMALRFRYPVSDRWKLGALLFLITASHGLLDAMTDGGLGVAFFSPFNRQRYFLPWTPIHVSPIGASGFFSARGLDVIWSEIVWIWGPAAVVGVVSYALAHRLREKGR
ncbi:MAG TPA: metal-dependent hydrolase [Candidatus Angelobacter sp.]|nr:metal-dependent hydrolase [Candidatus Angelobacter sp.]